MSRTRLALTLPGLVLALLILTPLAGFAQSGSGDLFGDLYHIKRDPLTGQPILQEREIELPGDVIGTGYCPIPIDANGLEIPFAPLSCEVDPAEAHRLVEVDYFGRLSGSRTRERNIRMHFDEVIAGIKNAEVVDVDDAGRLRLGTACDPGGSCAAWKTVDSPQENLAMYARILKYGHIQTDPLEEDTSPGGDPNEGTVYHPALDEDDWAKFRGVTLNMLPRTTASQCFPGGGFAADCADPQALAMPDFIIATSFLGGAADKTGRITPDLVQYLNRFLRIPIATPMTEAPFQTLPALIRDAGGVIRAATTEPAPADERFVDFALASYLRTDWFDRSVLVLQTPDAGLTYQPTVIELLQWLLFANGPMTTTATQMPAYVAAASDALRVVEFIHEYEVPANLWGAGARTHTAAHSLTVQYRASDQALQLTATVNATTPVNGGTVTFAVRDADGVGIGPVVTSAAVVNGAATAAYVLPGGTVPQTLVIVAVYGGTAEFAGSTGSGSLLVGQAGTTTTVDAAMTPLSATDQVVPLTAHLAWADSVPIGEGTVTFAVANANGVPVGAPVTVAVAGGAATAGYVLPGGLPAQRLTTTATFSGSARFVESSGQNVLSVGCVGITILPFTVPAGQVGAPYAAAFSTDGIPPTTLGVTGTLPPGLVLDGLMLSGTPTASGTFEFALAAVDAAGCTGTRSYTLRVEASVHTIATGPGAGVPGIVRHFEPNGTMTAGGEYAPFTAAWTGGVRVARGDLTGDGVPDTIVAAGPGGQPLVKAYNGATAGLIGSLLAFEATYTGGVNVAVGDLTGDGVVDVVAATATGAARVRVFNGANGALIYQFAPAVAGMSGVHVAVGDVNADGLADLVVGAGPGAEPRVRVYSAANGAVLHDFLAYPATFRGGVHVAAGDLTADGAADIVVGPGTGAGPFVRAFNGLSGAEIRAFWAADPAFLGGVRVAASDLTGDGHAEIIVAAGPGGPPVVKIFHGATNVELQSFLAYPAEVSAGVYVAAPVPARVPTLAPATTPAR